MKICWHDWEYIAIRDEADLRTEIELKGSGCRYRDYSGGAFRYHKRICLKCGKRQDTITPRLNEIRNENEMKKARQAKARSLYHCKNA